MTPEEAWTSKRSDLSHIRLFGTTVMVQVPEANRRKQQFKATECILVGYDEATKGYRAYDVEKKVVFKSRDVTFIDEGKVKSKTSSVPVNDYPGPERYIVIGKSSQDTDDSDRSDESYESETATRMKLSTRQPKRFHVGFVHAQFSIRMCIARTAKPTTTRHKLLGSGS